MAGVEGSLAAGSRMASQRPSPYARNGARAVPAPAEPRTLEMDLAPRTRKAQSGKVEVGSLSLMEKEPSSRERRGLARAGGGGVSRHFWGGQGGRAYRSRG